MDTKFFTGHNFLPNIKEKKELLDIWISCTPAQRKEFEEYLKAEKKLNCFIIS